MLNDSFDKLSWAVVQTVTYSDIFDYPLTAHEIHRYLTGIAASLEDVTLVLQEGPVKKTGGYFTLPGREKIVDIRVQREQHSRELLPTAIRYGRILGSLPYIRMVALTGSLAVLNVSKDEDFDYMLVTAPGRVWTARAFAVSFNRLVRTFGHTICPNLIVSENALEWPLHDLYSARELYQMIPITGMDVYRQLLAVNHWAAHFLPNALNTNTTNLANDAKGKNAYSRNSPVPEVRVRHFQHLLEFPLRGKLGDTFEAWEMNRKIARFSKQAGFGEETIFTADVCQGNFHHHRKWTREVFEAKLAALAAVPRERREAAVPEGSDAVVKQSPRTAIGANRL